MTRFATHFAALLVAVMITSTTLSAVTAVPAATQLVATTAPMLA